MKNKYTITIRNSEDQEVSRDYALNVKEYVDFIKMSGVLQEMIEVLELSKEPMK
uniref:Uncharacterized protein n=1 Tax=viral metagenome TaxID=1070528 RepID=A0A6M3XX29_9ZZZZ